MAAGAEPSEGAKLMYEQPRSKAAIAYRELANRGHFRGSSNRGSSSSQARGTDAGSTGGSVEATLTTITCSSPLASANWETSL